MWSCELSFLRSSCNFVNQANLYLSMLRPCLTHRVVIRGGLLFALMVALWSCPQSAEATCGDYVMTNGKHADASYGHHNGIRGDGQKSGNRVPCHGPGCSQRKSLPVGNLPVKLRVSHDQWALMGLAADAASDEFILFQPDPELSARMSYASRIFRPPR